MFIYRESERVLSGATQCFLPGNWTSLVCYWAEFMYPQNGTAFSKSKQRMYTRRRTKFVWYLSSGYRETEPVFSRTKQCLCTAKLDQLFLGLSSVRIPTKWTSSSWGWAVFIYAAAQPIFSETEQWFCTVKFSQSFRKLSSVYVPWIWAWAVFYVPGNLTALDWGWHVFMYKETEPVFSDQFSLNLGDVFNWKNWPFLSGSEQC